MGMILELQMVQDALNYSPWWAAAGPSGTLDSRVCVAQTELNFPSPLQAPNTTPYCYSPEEQDCVHKYKSTSFHGWKVYNGSQQYNQGLPHPASLLNMSAALALLPLSSSPSKMQLLLNAENAKGPRGLKWPQRCMQQGDRNLHLCLVD